MHLFGKAAKDTHKRLMEISLVSAKKFLENLSGLDGATPPKRIRIVMENFLKLFDIIFTRILRPWIPGLEYRICHSVDEINALYQDSTNYNDILRYTHHCLKIDDLHFDFHRDREILGVERAFIEWSLGRAFEYASNTGNKFLEQAIVNSLPKFLIATYLLFDSFNLNNSWKQFSDRFEYFGCTKSHYEITRRELFNATEESKVNSVIEIMNSVEKFSVSTDEGSRFSFSLLVAPNVHPTDGFMWKELVEKQYIKSLAQSNMLFIINEKGDFIDYKIPVANEDESFLANIFPSPPAIPEDRASVNAH